MGCLIKYNCDVVLYNLPMVLYNLPHGGMLKSLQCILREGRGMIVMQSRAYINFIVMTVSFLHFFVIFTDPI